MHNQQGVFRRLVYYFSKRHLKKNSDQEILDKKKTELLRRKRTSSDIYLLDMWAVDISDFFILRSGDDLVII